MEMVNSVFVIDGVLLDSQEEVARYKEPIKQMSDWKQKFDDAIKPGNRVSDEIYEEMLGCVPPLSFDNNHLAVGEAYDFCPEGKCDTYCSFVRGYNGVWVFVGNISPSKLREKRVLRRRRSSPR